MKTDHYLRIFLLMLDYQRRMRFYRRSPAAPTGLLEQHTLLELASSPGHTHSDLTTILNVQKSIISGVLESLKKQKFIDIAVAKHDRRSNTLKLTAAGKRLVGALDKYVDTITSRGLSHLTPQERNELAKFLHTLADGLGGHPIAMRSADHPVGIELRRISRVQGILGTRFMGTRFNITQTQILKTLAARKDSMSMSELCALMPFDVSTISKALSGLAQLRILAKVRSGADKRHFFLSLTAKGRAEFEELEARMRSTMKTALSGVSETALARFGDLLEKIASRPPFADEEVKERVEVRRLISDADRRAARGVFIENMVRQNSHFALDADLFSDSTTGYGFYLNGVLEGTCQLRKQGSRWVMENFCLSSNASNNGAARIFLDKVLADFKSTNSTRTVSLPKGIPHNC